MELYQKYRPKDLSEFIGQDKIKKQLSALMAREGWDRDSIWIQGPSGTGKTSLAWIVGRMVAGDDFDIIEYDGTDINKGAMTDIERNISLYPMFGGWKVYIINEAHNMTRAAVQSWLTILERLPAKRLIVFTTTENIEADLFGNFSSPFGRRCKVFTFTNQGLSQLFANRARKIADIENLNGKPEQAYIRLVQSCKNNMGMVLQRIEQAEMLV